jgi:hypothetical protein
MFARLPCERVVRGELAAVIGAADDLTAANAGYVARQSSDAAIRLTARATIL